MTDSRHTPNPLRPYYVPPSIGKDIPIGPNATTTKASTTSSFSFPDLDYTDYIPEASPSLAGTLKTGLDKAVWKYTNVLMAQPFEVAKLILQTRVAQEVDGDANMPLIPDAADQDQEDQEPDSEDDEPNYFTSSSPFIQSRSTSADRTPPRGRSNRPINPSRKPSKTTSHLSSSEHLQLRDPRSLLEALSALSSSDGTLAIWKATNTTFIYTILHRTLETFLRSFLAAVFGVVETEILLTTSSTLPDSSILNAASPTATVLIATAAAAFSSLILAPIDTARTLQILLPSTSSSKSLLSTIRTLRPSWLLPTHLIPVTFLSSAIPTLISTSTPLVLKTNLGLDPAINPTSWSVCTFLGSALDLSVKFPLETVLRRAQIATWASPELALTCTSTRSNTQQGIKTIVPVPTEYRGVLPTMWSIMRDEGFSESQKDRTAALMGKAPRRKRKGQGIEGLYRGWRVGLWGLVGVWGTAFVGGIQGDVAAGATPNAGKF